MPAASRGAEPRKSKISRRKRIPAAFRCNFMGTIEHNSSAGAHVCYRMLSMYVLYSEKMENHSCKLNRLENKASRSICVIVESLFARII